MALALWSNQFSPHLWVNIFYCSHQVFLWTAKGFRWLSGSRVYKFITMGVVPNDMHTDYIKPKFLDLFPVSAKCQVINVYLHIIHIYVLVLLSCQNLAFSFSQIICIKALQQD